jgi:hypothetical protein
MTQGSLELYHIPTAQLLLLRETHGQGGPISQSSGPADDGVEWFRRAPTCGVDSGLGIRGAVDRHQVVHRVQIAVHMRMSPLTLNHLSDRLTGAFKALKRSDAFTDPLFLYFRRR